MSNYAECHFRGQRPEETIIRVIHRHWFNIFIQFAGILAAFLLLVFGMALYQTFASNGSIAIDSRLAYFLGNTVFLFIWFSGFFIWIDYWFDMWIITDQRIVNIEQRGLFVREISELHLDRVQDVTAEVSGLIPSILNYGDVVVQTAGEQDYFRFRQVPDPNGIKDAIMKLIETNPGRNIQASKATIQTIFEKKS